MKSLVLYSSRSGNTKKLAQTVYETLGGEKKLASITDIVSLDSYDFIAIGFSIMGGRIEPRAKKFLQTFNNNADLFLFLTHGSLRQSQLVTDVKTQAVQLVKNANVIGTFTCQGEVAPGVLHKLQKGTTPPAWLDEAEYAKGHPTSQDMEELAEKIKTIC